MSNRAPTGLVLAGLLLLCGCQTCDRHGPKEPVAAAPYVFQGTVAEDGASTVDLVPASKETYTVRVDQIVFQKGTFTDQTGELITVVSADRALKRDSEYLFYTEPLVFGDGLAVRLVDAREGERMAAEDVKEAHVRHLIGERLKLAEVVVSGRVQIAEPYQEAQAVESEHLPELHQATLVVERALKGDLEEGDEIAFLFAASKDVMWYRAPKFSAGQQGVFLLRSAGADQAALGLEASQYTLFHPMDLQPLERLATIEELLR